MKGQETGDGSQNPYDTAGGALGAVGIALSPASVFNRYMNTIGTGFVRIG